MPTISLFWKPSVTLVKKRFKKLELEQPNLGLVYSVVLRKTASAELIDLVTVKTVGIRVLDY